MTGRFTEVKEEFGIDLQEDELESVKWFRLDEVKKKLINGCLCNPVYQFIFDDYDTYFETGTYTFQKQL